MLLFKKKFIPPILSGQKTQTIRLWRKTRLHAGKRSYIPGVGYIMIDSVDPVALEKLSDEDARLDGFPNAAALQKELRTIYGEKIQNGFQAFRIRFTRLPESEQIRIRQERQKFKAQQKKSGVGKSRSKKRTHYEKTMEKLKKMVDDAQE